MLTLTPSSLAALLASLLLAFVTSTHAATVTWDGSTNTVWSNNDATSWSGSTFLSGDSALFGNTGVGTVSFSGTVNAANVTFAHTSGTYSVPFTAATKLVATGALSVTGGGTVNFGGGTTEPSAMSFHATWNGGTVISGGSTLGLTRPDNIGASGTSVTLDNGTLRLASDTTFNQTSNNPFAINSGGGTIIGNNGSFTLSGNVSGSGALNLTTRVDSAVFGSATPGNPTRAGGLRFSGSNSGFTGPVTLSSLTTTSPQGHYGAGTIEFASAGAMFSSASAVSVKNGAVLVVQFAAANADVANVSTGYLGGIGASGASGSLASLSANPLSYVGKGGDLYLDNTSAVNNNRIADSAALALNDQRLFIRGRSLASSRVTEVIGDLSATGSARVTLEVNNTSSSGLGLTASSLSISGAGNTLMLDNNNASTAAWSSAASDAVITITGAKPSVTNGMVTPAIQHVAGINGTGDFMTFSGNDLIRATASYTNYTSDFAAATASQIVNVTNASSTLTGTGDLSVYALRFQGSGTQSLGGRRVLVGSGGVILSPGTVSSGTLDFGAVPGFIGAYNGNSQVTLSAKLSGTAGITFTGASQSVDITATNNDFTGGLWVNAGNVTLASSNAANGNNVSVGAFGRLQAGVSGGTTTIGGLSGTGRVLADFQGNSASSATLAIAPTSGTHSFDGLITNGDAGRVLNLSKSGAGTQVLSNGSNSYSGTTTVSGGILEVTAAGALGATSSGTVVNSGGTLHLVNVNLGNEAVTLNGTGAGGIGALKATGSVTLGAALNLASDSSIGLASAGDTLTLLGGITGSGSYTKVGAGTLIGGATASYTGSTIISEGIFEVSTNNALGTVAGGTSVASNAALRLNNVAYTTAEPLSLNGSGISGGGALVNVGTSSYAGQITATTHASIHTGGGTLTVSGGLVKNGTTLTIAGGGKVIVNSVGISGASANSDLVVDASTLVVNTNSNYNGPTTVQNGGTLVANATVQSTSVTVNAGSTLSGTGRVETAANDYVFINGAIIVGDSTLSSPVPSMLQIYTSGSGGMVTGAATTFAFDLFSRGGDLSTMPSAADLIQMVGSIDAMLGGSLILSNPNSLSGFAIGDTWKLFDFSSGGSLNTGFTLNYSALNLPVELAGSFNHSTGLFTLVSSGVPEPGRAALLGLGLGLLVWRRRRVLDLG